MHDIPTTQEVFRYTFGGTCSDLNHAGRLARQAGPGDQTSAPCRQVLKMRGYHAPVCVQVSAAGGAIIFPCLAGMGFRQEPPHPSWWTTDCGHPAQTQKRQSSAATPISNCLTQSPIMRFSHQGGTHPSTHCVVASFGPQGARKQLHTVLRAPHRHSPGAAKAARKFHPRCVRRRRQASRRPGGGSWCR